VNTNDGLTMLVDALPGLNRVRAVQRALDGRVKPVYLEIGVSKGLAFRRISADEKIAVDPEFRLSARSRAQADAKGRVTHYFETTSDDFFANEAAFLEQCPIDVALIDGMHTYEQVVRDVENTVRYLQDDGVIFLHDCNPATELIGRRAESWADFIAQQKGPLVIGVWSGDVWKSIVYLRSMRHDLRVAVLKCDMGVGVIRKGTFGFAIVLLASGGRGVRLQRSRRRPRALAEPEAAPVSRHISRCERRISPQIKEAGRSAALASCALDRCRSGTRQCAASDPCKPGQLLQPW